MKLRLLIVTLLTLGGVGANIARPNSAALAASAAAPTFSTPCFTSSNINQTASYTVPATGVSTVRAVLRGQNGQGHYFPAGGQGSTLIVEVAVTPGEVLQVGRLTGAAGGTGAGSVNQNGVVYDGVAGGNGGDAEYLSTAGADGCQHALAVAGGGGGAGIGDALSHAVGGNADAGTGATAGGDGGWDYDVDGAGGHGATAAGGGSGGAAGHSGAYCNGNAGSSGGFLTGGNGGDGPGPLDAVPCDYPGSGGGGGGAGYYGGGGGGSPYADNNPGGGGGGSSYIDPSATKVSESAGASAGDPVVVPVYDTAITIASSPNPSFIGNSVTITAHVTSVGPGQPVPGGTVEFFNGNSSIGTAQVVTNGDATFTTTSLPVGSDYLQAHFYDTLNATEADRGSWTQAPYVNGMQVVYTQVVHPCAPAPLITNQPVGFSAVYGTNVTFHAGVSVSPGYGGVPQVQFQTSTDGGTTWTNAPGNVSIIDSGTGTADAQLSFNVSVRPGYLEYRAVATTCGGTATSNPATLTVNPAPLTITANDKTMSGGSMPVLDATYGDPTIGVSAILRNGDTPSSLSGTLTCTTTATSFSAPGTYPITCSGQSSPNYIITYRQGTLTVTNPIQAIILSGSTALTKTYGDAAFDMSSYVSASSGLAVSFSSATSSVCTVSGSMVTLLAAGTCTINADQAGNSVYPPAPEAQQSFTVNKKALTVVAGTPPSQPYGTASAPTVTCTADFVGADTFVTSPTGGVYRWLYNFDAYRLIGVDAITPVGNYITRCVGGTVNSNYTISGYTDGTFKITAAVSKANQTITFASLGNKTYGDADVDPGATASSGLPVSYSVGSTDNCTIVSGKVHLTGAGTCTVTASQGGNTSYNPATSVSLTFTIAKATLTITPTHDAISYGDPAPMDGWGYTASGFVGTDTATTTTISGDPSGCTTTYAPNDPPGSSYTITCTDTSGMSAANYTFSPASGSLTVGTRAITVTATDAGYTYGDTPPASYGGTVTGGSLAGTDSLSSLGVTCSPVDSTSTPFTPTTTTAAGSYPIVCRDGSTADYSYTYLPGTLTISPASITVTASNPASQTYGATSAPSISCTGSGFLNGDTFATPPTGAVYDSAGTTKTTIGSTSNAGSYSTECNGGDAGSNYTIQGYTPGTFTISPASLTITASDGTMTYGDSAPTITPSYSGFMNSDSATSLTTAPTCGTAATSGSGAGQYASSCSGAAGSNYTITYVPGSVTVNPAALAVTAPSPTMTYGDATLPSLAPATVTGLKNSDTFSSLGGICSLLTTGSTPTAVTLSASTTAGTYTVHCSGVTSTNYTVTDTDGSLTVNKAPLTVTADTKTGQYSDPMPALTATISGFVNNQTLATSGVTGSPSCSTAAGSTVVTVGQGSAVITCTAGTLTAANYSFPAAHFVNGALTVGQETAAIQYTGGSAVALPSSGSATITLSTTVWDSAAKGYPNWGAKDTDGLTSDTPGDVTKMQVQWAIWPSSSCLIGSPTQVIGPVGVNGTGGIGTASTTWSQSTEGSYCVVAQVVGSTQNSPNQYYTANAAQVAGIAFYQNTGQFATGGGWIADNTQGGTGQGTLSFNARYTKTGGAKGQVAYSWQGMYNGQLANFTITSNAISTLSISGGTTAIPAITATLQGKCAESIVSVATGQVLSSQGNLTFTATAKDGDYGLSQNIPSDAFSLSVFNSSNQSIKQVASTPLGGGNLAVHNG